MATTNYIVGLKGTNNTTYYLNEGVDTRFFRGTCTTAKGTAAKTATLDDATNFSLTTGVKVAITFINGSSVTNSAATLNINSTGAKTVIVKDSSNTAGYSNTVLTTYDDMNIYSPVMVCQPYEVMFFVYDGTYWLQSNTSPIANITALTNSWINGERLDMIASGSSNIVNVQHGGTGMTTSNYKNAVVIGNASTATNSMQTVRTGNGAFYATAQDGAPSFGTLPVAQGGTGATSFTANSIIMSNSTTTGALTTRAVTNNTTATAISTGTNIPTMNTIYYGLPTINNSHTYTSSTTIYAPTAGGTSGYYLKGAGTTTAPTWQAPADSSSASAISTGTALVTERDVYYGLPTINGAHTYTSSTNFYIPTTAGTSGQILSSSGSGAPTWVDSSTVGSKIQIVRW